MKEYTEKVREESRIASKIVFCTLTTYLLKVPGSRSSSSCEWDTMPELGTNVAFKVNGKDISGELTWSSDYLGMFFNFDKDRGKYKMSQGGIQEQIKLLCHLSESNLCQPFNIFSSTT